MECGRVKCTDFLEGTAYDCDSQIFTIYNKNTKISACKSRSIIFEAKIFMHIINFEWKFVNWSPHCVYIFIYTHTNSLIFAKYARLHK